EEKIDVILKTRVTAIDRANKSVELDNGTTLNWNKLAITTGTRVRPLDAAGVELEGVHYLRTLDDTLKVRENLSPGGTALIVGGGWIGLECAATLTKLGYETIVVEYADRLCSRAVTPEISDWMLHYHQGNGVKVLLNTGVNSLSGRDDHVESATLSDGTVINCSKVIIGIGVIPNTELAEQAGLTIDNGILVDELCQTNDPNIFAAGDVSNHPNNILGRRLRLESWENAMNQGIATGKSMLGKGIAYSEIPWFWSDQFEANIQMIGLPEEWDETATRGDKGKHEFVEFYLKNKLIVGAISVNSTRDLRMAKRLMQAQKEVAKIDLENPEIKIQALLKS
ncbi:MAG: NAD(P)/FAD-dependent oxidoreductase, partial [Alphaproteobacteria bacterium]